MVLAAALRLHGAWRGGLSNDELFSWRLTRYAWCDLVHRAAIDGHPPLHFVVLKAWSALTGDSMQSLRAVSVLFGLATVYLVVRSVVEAETLNGNRHRLSNAVLIGALAAGLFAALAPLQLAGGRTARMYAQGAMFAGLSACLLPRVLLGKQPRLLWPVAYGLSIAALCHTHHFGLFTVFAQGLFAIFYVCGAKSPNPGGASPRVALAMASASGLALYSVWLPVLVGQAQRLHARFWIPEPTVFDALRGFFEWSFGSCWQGIGVGAAGTLLLLIVVPFTLSRGGHAARFFFCQAMVPWICCLAISTFGKRPILLERYLTFAQVAWFGFLGLAIASAASTRLRLALVALLAPFFGVGACIAATQGRAHDPKSKALEYLLENYRPGDSVIVGPASDLNALRYVSRRRGALDIDASCRSDVATANVSAAGLPVQLASLRDDERCVPGHDPKSGCKRIWVAWPSREVIPEQPAGMVQAMTRTFNGMDGSSYFVRLYTRGSEP